MEARRQKATRIDQAWDLVRRHKPFDAAAKLVWHFLASRSDREGNLDVRPQEIAAYLGRGERSVASPMQKLTAKKADDKLGWVTHRCPPASTLWRLYLAHPTELIEPAHERPLLPDDHPFNAGDFPLALRGSAWQTLVDDPGWQAVRTLRSNGRYLGHETMLAWGALRLLAGPLPREGVEVSISPKLLAADQGTSAKAGRDYLSQLASFGLIEIKEQTRFCWQVLVKSVVQRARLVAPSHGVPSQLVLPAVLEEQTGPDELPVHWSETSDGCSSSGPCTDRDISVPEPAPVGELTPTIATYPVQGTSIEATQVVQGTSLHPLEETLEGRSLDQPSTLAQYAKVSGQSGPETASTQVVQGTSIEPASDPADRTERTVWLYGQMRGARPQHIGGVLRTILASYPNPAEKQQYALGLQAWIQRMVGHEMEASPAITLSWHIVEGRFPPMQLTFAVLKMLQMEREGKITKSRGKFFFGRIRTIYGKLGLSERQPDTVFAANKFQPRKPR